jgi:hypothetical protein
VITVIGKWLDVADYMGKRGYNVMPFDPNWTLERNHAWMDEAIKRGDKILIVSNDYSGEFRNELLYLLDSMLKR